MAERRGETGGLAALSRLGRACSRAVLGVAVVWLVAVATVAPASGIEAPQAAIARLRHDGLYGAPAPGDGYAYWLRFYPDGTVLSVSSTGTAEQVAGWLNEGYDGAAVGTVARDGFIVSFSVASRAGIVDYWGTIGVDLLDLASTSHINGFEQRLAYRFHPVEGW